MNFYHEQPRTNTNKRKIPKYKFVRFVWFVVKFSEEL